MKPPPLWRRFAPWREELELKTEQQLLQLLLCLRSGNPSNHDACANLVPNITSVIVSAALQDT